jgi:midasin
MMHHYICCNTNRDGVEGAFAFSFIEGALVKAVREGHWVLLDEINLASAETLQRLASLLEVR